MINLKIKNMKKSIVILSLLMISFGFAANAQDVQSEEYAIVDVYQMVKKQMIYITIGEEPATVKEWEWERTEKNPQSLSPVVIELNKLNKMGYELLNMSSTYTTTSMPNIHGTPRFTFMMVKKAD